MKLRIKSMIWNTRKQKTTNQNKKKKVSKKNKDSVRNLWHNFKRYNVCNIRVSEEEKEQEIGNLFENIMKENFPNLVKEIDMQVQEAQIVPNKMDTKRPIPRHIIIKMPKVINDSERFLKAVRVKQLVTHRGVPIILSADFSKETFFSEKFAERDLQEIFKVMKSRDLQPRFLYPAKLSFSIKVQADLPRQEKAKGVHPHQTIIKRNVKGAYVRKDQNYE